LDAASLRDNRGSGQGSSDKKNNSFIYDNALNASSLEALLLTNVNCLGADDTRFVGGQEVEFRIEVVPDDTTIGPGEPYNLTVIVTHQGSRPHIVTQSTELKVPPKSPQKTRKRG